MPKCQVCNEVSRLADMTVCEIVELKKRKKDGTPRINRKYAHIDCLQVYIDKKKFRQEEAEKLDDLHVYLSRLHDLVNLDRRMFEKIQDLRNGTIKVNNRKIKKHKEGVPYELMLQTYKHLASDIDRILQTMEFKEKWNEFSYIFGVVLRNLNEVAQMNKRQQKHEDKLKTPLDTEGIGINIPIKKKKSKDDLDITDFL